MVGKGQAVCVSLIESTNQAVQKYCRPIIGCLGRHQPADQDQDPLPIGRPPEGVFRFVGDCIGNFIHSMGELDA